jgi:hypothetical protein
MRIMDGSCKQGQYLGKDKEAHLENPEQALENLKQKRRKLEANEEDLKKYEEQVFVETIVEDKMFRNKRELYKEFSNLRSKS